jgi:hypothetical protein
LTSPTQIEPLPSAFDTMAEDTGDIDIQLCETGKLNSMPKLPPRRRDTRSVRLLIVVFA